MLSAGVIFFLAALQGVTELFPVSSLGHAVVVPPLIGLNFRETSPAFVPVLAVLHLGTAAALLFLYRRDWVRIIRGFFGAAVHGRIDGPDQRMAIMLIVGTVPTGVIGFLLQDPLKSLFGDPRAASIFLIVNGGILFAAEMFRRRDERRRAVAGAPVLAHEEDDPEYQRVEGLSLRTTVIVGVCQAGALLPGISRSGITMAAGLVAGLRHEEAARFSFLLATPIILAAGLLELPTLVQTHRRWWLRSARRSSRAWWHTAARDSCSAISVSDASTPSRITVPLSGPRASSSSTDGREMMVHLPRFAPNARPHSPGDLSDAW